MKILLCLFFVVVAVFQRNVGADSTPVTLAQSSLDFSWNAYQALKVESGKNVFLSPYSITNALGMLVLGSTGTTQSDILTALDVPTTMSTTQLHEQLEAENDKLAAEKNATIGVANRFFVVDNLVDKVNPDYATNLQNYYNATVASTPFATDPSASREMINEFVSNNTHGEIPQLLADDLPTSTILTLVNAIYFKGLWTTPFNVNDTIKDTFHAINGDVQADFMSLPPKTILPYNECSNGDCQLVILTYTDLGTYAMIFVVPKEGTTLNSLESSLDPQTLRTLWTGAKDEKVNFRMPRFSMDNHFSLKDMLIQLGATHIFGPDGADNSIIFTEDEGLMVDDVIHEAKVKVDETGTVAAAATAVVVTTSAVFPPPPPPKIVNLDRPFLFFIADMSNDFVLFWGRTADPTQST